MRNLTLRQLAAFAAVAQERSITRAAEVIGLTPSATTSRIKELEAAAGIPLFERTSSGMILNDAGSIMLRLANHIDSAVKLAEASLADLKGVVAGRLAVGITSTAKYFAPHVIAGFSRLHPQVEVSLTVGNREQVIEALTRMTIDVAIMGRPPPEGHVRAEAFGRHPLVVVAAPGHPLARRAHVALDDLAEEPFLLREEGSGTRSVFDELFREARPRQGRVFIEIGSNETIKQGVMAGLGLALISAHTIAFEVELGRLVVLPVEGTPVWRRWFSAYRVDKTEMPAMRAFRHYLMEEGLRHLPKLPGLGPAPDDP